MLDLFVLFGIGYFKLENLRKENNIMIQDFKIQVKVTNQIRMKNQIQKTHLFKKNFDKIINIIYHSFQMEFIIYLNIKYRINCL